MGKYNQYEYAKKNFFQPLKKESAANYAYNNLTYKEQKRLIKELPSVFQKYMYIKTSLPSSFSDFIIKVQFAPDELMKGLGCLVNQLLPYRTQLNEYVSYKNKYESLLLTGDYDECEKILDKIDNICISIWSLEMRLLVRYQRYGAKDALDYKDKVAEDASPLIKILISMLWTKVEAKYSLSSIEQNMYLTFNKNGINESFAAYFKYLILKNHSEYKWVDCLWIVLMTSVIDIYEFVVDAIIDQTDKITKDDMYIMKSMAMDLEKQIEDNRLKGIIRQYDKNADSVIDEEHDLLLTSFERKDYHYVYSHALHYLYQNPANFDIMDIYVKSAVCLREDKISIGNLNRKSLGYKVIRGLFHYMRNDDYCNVSLGMLEVIGNQISTLKTGSCLAEKIKGYRDLHYSPVKYCIYNGYEHYSDDNISEVNCLNYIQEINPVFLKQKVVALCFESKVRDRLDKEAIQIYLDSYFVNKAYVELVDTKSLFKRHDEMLIFLDLPDLETAIFYALSGAPHYMVYHFFKKYIKRQKTQIPSTLLEGYHDNIPNIMECFFHRVCTIETIKSFIKQFPNSDMALEERLKILTLLSQIKNSSSKKEYLDEITRIKRRQGVNKRIQKLDQRMIYVDETALKETELEEVKKQFLVYRETENTIETQQYLLEAMNVDSNGKLNVGDLKYKTVKVIYKNLLFRQMFMEIRKQFLTSYKYGLDFYLSTRIRHGTLLNQMRQAFESNKIVTNKIDKVYKDDTSISERVLGLDGEIKEKVKAKLKEFSKEVDDYIIYIKNEIVQVQALDLPEQHPNAMFNFDTVNSDTEITGLYLDKLCQVTDYVEFIEIIFAYLWECTEIELENMRSYLDTVKVNLSNKIMKLQNEITAIVGENNRLDGFIEITNKANHDMMIDVDKVKKWFYRGKCDDDDFTVRDVIDACKESASIHRNVIFDPKVIGNSSTLLKGEYFRKMSDLLLIFFNNIIEYNGIEVKDSCSEVVYSENGDIIEMTIKNKLADDDIDKLKKYVEVVENNFKDTAFLKKTSKEKGSGHIKAYNMIHNMLPYDKDAFKIMVKEGCFVVTFRIAITYWKAHENSYC